MIWRCLLTLLTWLSLTADAALAQERLRLVSTTTTENSGLMPAILPFFEMDTGIKVDLLVTGTGQALRIGRQGDADALLVHDPSGEAQFVAEGHSGVQAQVMYNHFLLVGPKDDPAGLRAAKSVEQAFERLAKARAPFVSRGDTSGTHQAERRAWSDIGLEPEGRWYRETGAGMGATLNMASALDAYTLVDLGSWHAFSNRGSLEVLFEDRVALRNLYTIHVLDDARYEHVNAVAAQKLLDWMSGERGQRTIADHRVNDIPVFCPIDQNLVPSESVFCDLFDR